MIDRPEVFYIIQPTVSRPSVSIPSNLTNGSCLQRLTLRSIRDKLWTICTFVIAYLSEGLCLFTLRPRQNGRYFPDNIFEYIFLKENVWIPIKISLKFVPKSPINNVPALVQIMTWRRPGDKPLSEPMLVRLPTHICVTRPQWANRIGREETRLF